MSFTPQELANISASALDFHLKGPALDNNIQDKPLLDAMMSAQKTFPGGKEFITMPVKGVRSSALEGFSHDDTVTYGNPAQTKRAQYSWYELHEGIALTLTELKKDGISVVDSSDSAQTSEHSDRELTALTGILEEKLDDMTQGWTESFNAMLWKDGTQDAKEIPGILSIITDSPATGVVGGINGATSPWWRNHARTGSLSATDYTGAAIDASTASNLNLIKDTTKLLRQVRRRGGRPSVWLAGSDYIEAAEAELLSSGNFTREGWQNSKNTQVGIADISYKGMKCVYDPTLDDIGRTKYGYFIDPRHLQLRVMEGEDKKQHTPTRPAERYVMYRAMTYTGGLVCNRRNANAVQAIS